MGEPDPHRVGACSSGTVWLHGLQTSLEVSFYKCMRAAVHLLFSSACSANAMEGACMGTTHDYHEAHFVI